VRALFIESAVTSAEPFPALPISVRRTEDHAREITETGNEAQREKREAFKGSRCNNSTGGHYLLHDYAAIRRTLRAFNDTSKIASYHIYHPKILQYSIFKLTTLLSLCRSHPIDLSIPTRNSQKQE
jgi:hypothetical protein